MLSRFKRLIRTRNLPIFKNLLRRRFGDKPTFEHYKILEIEGGIKDTKELKKAFKLMAKKYHPDKNPEYKDKFVKILEAYKLISQDLKHQLQQDGQANYTNVSDNDNDPLFDEDEIKDDPLYKWLNKIYAETEQEKQERELEERQKLQLE